MTPDQARAMYRRQMRKGETVTLRRGPTSAPIDAQVRARVTGYSVQELTGGIDQGARKVILMAEDVEAAAADGWPAPPKQNDGLLVRGKRMNIEYVDDSTRRVAGELIAYEMRVSGA